jgi:inosine/xanthosine triphosphatase
LTRSAERTPLVSLREVRVGSTSEPKIAAVRGALDAFVRGVRVAGVEVDSGVPAQPLGFREIVLGARNRAARARASGACDLGVGIEDGLVPLPVEESGEELRHLNVGCVAVTDGERFGVGFSSGFAYPPECSLRAARAREPIGALFDQMWRERRGDPAEPRSTGSGGNVGRLSCGALPRSEYGRHAVLCALIPFLHPDLYRGGGPVA